MKKIITIRKFIILFFSIIISKYVNGSRAKFGDYCDKSIRCDSLAFLTCQNESCACLKPESMIYDHGQGNCVALAGEKCKFIVVEEYRSWLEEVGCVCNAKCLQSGICICDMQFNEAANGSCIPKRMFGEACDSSGDCRSDFHLNCNDGVCSCDLESTIYDHEQRRCVGLANKACTLGDQCTANAICRGYYGGHSIDSYEEYSGEDTKCACSPGYVMSPNGLCQVSHGGGCDLDTQCLDKFKCQDGTCTCMFQEHQIYEEMYQNCYSLVGGPCTSPKNTSTTHNALYCIKPAVCLPRGNFRFECACPEGMIENVDRRCELIHGRICSMHPTNSTALNKNENNGLLKCDSHAPLFCIQGKCQCKDEFKIYDQETKKCRGLVGSGCTRGGKNENFCVDGADCLPYRGNNIIGKCECTKYFVELQNKTCGSDEDNAMF